MRSEISKRQLEALRSIDAFMKLNKYAPSHKDIADEMNIKSTFGVRKHLNALAARKLIVQLQGGYRSIRITESGYLSLETKSP